ncbi:MAG: hypothetical protein V7L23_15310 [Nostoc sp.]|uniref:hypothetical protein n=1 Tax=Nostoc sp. TaxID=1180 RepID=UPI002FEF1497
MKFKEFTEGLASLAKAIAQLMIDLFLRDYKWFRRLCGGFWRRCNVSLFSSPVFYWTNEDFKLGEGSDEWAECEFWGERRINVILDLNKPIKEEIIAHEQEEEARTKESVFQPKTSSEIP